MQSLSEMGYSFVASKISKKFLISKYSARYLLFLLKLK